MVLNTIIGSLANRFARALAGPAVVTTTLVRTFGPEGILLVTLPDALLSMILLTETASGTVEVLPQSVVALFLTQVPTELLAPPRLHARCRSPSLLAIAPKITALL